MFKLPKVKKCINDGLSGLERTAGVAVIGVALTVGGSLAGGPSALASVADSNSQITTGQDFSAVMLRPAESVGNGMHAWHSSHSSHASHASHASHYSHYSSRY